MSNLIETITMYRPIGKKEWQLVQDSDCTKWPPRLPEQPIFYPVTNEKYAREITCKWNIPDDGVGYVCRFAVTKSFAERYKIEQVGADYHTEWWIPAEDVDNLNENIVGKIELVGEYH
ncbi:hypothetical protein [Candidatus Uabimicrobium sp. HlEnr_7]|uniref:hypothetical protein n=1 Tax=Candidatus Uabimicrobium helgolandensis TaxID=3095367 RepID=UPI0035570FDB